MTVLFMIMGCQVNQKEKYFLTDDSSDGNGEDAERITLLAHGYVGEKTGCCMWKDFK